MRPGSVWIAAAAAALTIGTVACGGGNGGSGSLPRSGAAVCEDVHELDRVHFVFQYTTESEQQRDPPPDESVPPLYSIKPSQPSFKLELRHDGSYVKPDRFDFQLTDVSQINQPAVRVIRIGQNVWHNFPNSDRWIPLNQPTDFPFSPPAVCDAVVAPLNLEGQTGEPEVLNGVETRKIHIEDVQMESAAKLLGPNGDPGRLLKSYDIDLWLSEDKDRLVKVDAVGTAAYPFGRPIGVRFTLELGPYNDDDINDIEAPPVG